jgi:dTMP kinase
MQKGKFIVLTGIEGCGKTTQLALLTEWLGSQEIPTLGTREPGGTAVGERLRSVIMEHHEVTSLAELLLFSADRAQHVTSIVKPSLAAGLWVACDRFAESTVAYQCYGRGVDVDLVWQLNAIAAQGVRPDLTIWLDVPVKVALDRVQSRGDGNRIDWEPEDFHHRVRAGYRAQFEASGFCWTSIDGQGSIEDVSKLIQKAVRRELMGDVAHA